MIRRDHLRGIPHRMGSLLAPMLAALLVSGCANIHMANSIARLTVASGKPVALDGASLQLVKAGATAESSAAFFPILFPIPLGIPTMDQSTGRLLETTEGDVILNYKGEVFVDLFTPMGLLYFGRFGYRGSGDVYRIVRPAAGTPQSAGVASVP